VVLQQGRIVEQGDHDQLIATKASTPTSTPATTPRSTTWHKRGMSRRSRCTPERVHSPSRKPAPSVMLITNQNDRVDTMTNQTALSAGEEAALQPIPTPGSHTEPATSCTAGSTAQGQYVSPRTLVSLAGGQGLE